MSSRKQILHHQLSLTKRNKDLQVHENKAHDSPCKAMQHESTQRYITSIARELSVGRVGRVGGLGGVKSLYCL